ncbi:MAG: 30S ribosomal protein S7 [bacterium]|nr:30S ribosomal protein S7 [bacterium]MBK8128582.1 30S ribosomal protein S7 [bacterium]
MPRRKRIFKREIPADPKFGSLQVAQFINGLLKRGKRSTAERMFYGAFDIIEAKAKSDPLDVFNKAMKNVAPVVEVKSRRVGGATYQVPVEVNPSRRQALAIRWIIGYATSRGEKTMAEKLAGEMIAAAKGEGNSVKKRDDTHKMAEANKAFAHFRW